MLSIKEVTERYKVARSTIYRWLGSGAFPKPVRIGDGDTVRWREEDLDAFDRKGKVEMIQLDDKDWEAMQATTGEWTSTYREAMKKENPDNGNTLRELKVQLGLSGDSTNGEVLGATMDTKSEIQRLKIIVRKIRGLLK